MMSRLGTEACTIITSLKLLLEELFPSRDLSLKIHLTNCWWLLPLIALTGEDTISSNSSYPAHHSPQVHPFTGLFILAPAILNALDNQGILSFMAPSFHPHSVVLVYLSLFLLLSLPNLAALPPFPPKSPSSGPQNRVLEPLTLPSLELSFLHSCGRKSRFAYLCPQCLAFGSHLDTRVHTSGKCTFHEGHLEVGN